jgi:hypothetical protein
MSRPVTVIRVARWAYALGLAAVILAFLPIIFFMLALAFGGTIG